MSSKTYTSWNNILFKLTEEEKLQLTRAIMSLLHEWGVTADQQIIILGMPGDTKARHMQKYRQTTPFPEDDNVLTHIEHIMGIAEALRTTYPLNNNMSKHWLHTPHRRFYKKTPLQHILEEGLQGLIAVRCHLDCAYDWERDQQRARNT